MRYEERPAPPGLEHAVSRIWYLETQRVRRFEKILPLPFVHVIVNLSDPYAIYDRAGRVTPVDDAFVSGIQSEYLVIESPPLIRHVGIELLPAGLGAMTDAAGPDIAGRVRDARPLVPGIAGLVASLRSSAEDPDRMLQLTTDFLEAAPARPPDPVVAAALGGIHADPSAAIADIARQAGTASHALLTRFRAATGITPKAYAQLWRFHRFVNDLAVTPGRPDWAVLAAESGFYDQPHVIRAFRRFSGWTPAEYRRRVVEFGPDAAHFVPMDEVPPATLTPGRTPPAASR